VEEDRKYLLAAFEEAEKSLKEGNTQFHASILTAFGCQKNQ